MNDQEIKAASAPTKRDESEFDNRGEKWVYAADLPLSCPMPDQPLWNAHPRVYLPIEATGEAICPYCSAVYILKDFQENKGPDILYEQESLE